MFFAYFLMHIATIINRKINLTINNYATRKIHLMCSNLPPLDFISFTSLLSTPFTRFFRCSSGTSVQALQTAAHNASTLEYCLPFSYTFCFISDQSISIGFTSGLLGGQIMSFDPSMP